MHVNIKLTLLTNISSYTIKEFIYNTFKELKKKNFKYRNQYYILHNLCYFVYCYH